MPLPTKSITSDVKGIHYYDAIIQPSMDHMLTTVNQDSLHFGDITAALSSLRLAFEQLNQCGEYQGQMTTEFMSNVISETKRSPFKHISSMYSHPTSSMLSGGSGSGSGGGRIDDADAAHKVAKALLSRT